MTADFQVHNATSFQLLLMVFTVANMYTACFVSCGFWMTFIFIQLLNFFFALMISFANVSSLLQVAIILDLRHTWYTRQNQTSWKVTQMHGCVDYHVWYCVILCIISCGYVACDFVLVCVMLCVMVCVVVWVVRKVVVWWNEWFYVVLGFDLWQTYRHL